MSGVAVGTMRVTLLLLTRVARPLLLALALVAAIAALSAVSAMSMMSIGTLRVTLRALLLAMTAVALVAALSAFGMLLIVALVAVLATLAVLAAVGLDGSGRREAAAAVRLALADIVAARSWLQPLDCLDRGHEALRQRAIGQLRPHQLFDVTQVDPLVGRAKGDRFALGPGAGGPADAVDILFRNVGQVEIDDMADARDV